MNNQKNTPVTYSPESPYGSYYASVNFPRRPYELSHLSDEAYYQSNFSFNREFESAQHQIHRTWFEQSRSLHRGTCKEQCNHPHIITQGEVLVFGNYSAKSNPEIVTDGSGTKNYTWHRVDPTWRSNWSNQGS